MALALAASYFVNETTNTTPATLTTPSFTPATNELIIIKGVTENYTTGIGPPTATGGGITWTKRVENTTVNNCFASIWSGVVTSGGTAITVTGNLTDNGNPTGYGAIVVERWTTAQLAGTPATAAVVNGASTTATITTVGVGSVVSYADGDWNAVAPGVPAYASSATQDGLDDKSSGVHYASYFAYQSAPTAGTQTFGLTAPTGRKDSIVAIEIQDSTGGTVTPHLFMLTGVGI
jgi:hypothetical protein